MEKERKAFEGQNFIKRLLGYSKYDEDRNEYVYFRFEDYAIRDTCELNTAWKAWQASANRQGYKLVPIKCTNNMAHAAKEVDGRLSAFKYGDVWEAMIGVVE